MTTNSLPSDADVEVTYESSSSTFRSGALKAPMGTQSKWISEMVPAERHRPAPPSLRAAVASMTTSSETGL